jgi:phosphatidylserine/phosphatidylglycerophosphate/cardiolipin synthase-like enzyme
LDVPAPLDLQLRLRMLHGRDLYREVVRDGILAARRSVWIATANLKELYVEGAGLGRRYRSILAVFEDLAARGVDLRILHADVPSRRFRAAFDRRPSLVRGGLKLKHCPRVHMKAVVLDGERVYLGSANLTGAGLGAKGDARRNFEIGFMTEELRVLDDVQTLFAALWAGAPCDGCAVRELCPDPGAYGAGRLVAKKPRARALAARDDTPGED